MIRFTEQVDELTATRPEPLRNRRRGDRHWARRMLRGFTAPPLWWARLFVAKPVAAVLIVAAGVLATATVLRFAKPHHVIIVEPFHVSRQGSVTGDVTGGSISHAVSGAMEDVAREADEGFRLSVSSGRVEEKHSIGQMLHFDQFRLTAPISPEAARVQPLEVAGISLDRLAVEWNRIRDDRSTVGGHAIFEGDSVTLRARIAGRGEWQAGPHFAAGGGLRQTARLLALQIWTHMHPLVAGGYYLRQDSVHQAIALFRHWLAEDTTVAAAHLALGVAYYRNHQPELAIRHYGSALELPSDRAADADVYRLLGLARLASNDIPGARSEFGKSGNASDRDIDVLLALGTALSLMRREDENGAVDALRRAIGRLENEPRLHTALGFALIGRLSSESVRSVLELTSGYTTPMSYAQVNVTELRFRGELLGSDGENPGNGVPAAGSQRFTMESRRNLANSISHEGWPLRLPPVGGTTETLTLPQPRVADLPAREAPDPRLDTAITAFTRARDLDPDDPGTHHNLAVALMAKDSVSRAIEHFRQAIARDPRFFEAHLELGNAHLLRREIDAALPALRTARELRPDDPRAHHLIGIADAHAGRLDDAVKGFDTALERGAEPAPVHLAVGVTLLKQNRVTEAVERLRAAVEADSSISDGLYQLGLARLRAGRAQEAIRTLQDALDRRETPEARYVLGIAYLQADQPRLAISHLSAAEAVIDLRTAHELLGVAHYSLGLAQLEAGDAGEATAAFRRALRYRPSYPESEYALGVALLSNSQDPQEAAVRFRSVIARRSSFADAYTGLGVAQFLSQNDEEALGSLRTAVILNGASTVARHGLGASFARLGEYDSAIVQLTAALELDPTAHESQYLRGWVQLWNGEYSPAAADFRATPQYAAAPYGLGAALFLGGRLEEAIASYRQAAPSFPAAYTDLATALLLSGRAAEAVEEFRNAIANGQRDPRTFNNLAWALYHLGGPDRLAEAASLSDQSLAGEVHDAEGWGYRDTRANIALDMGDAQRALDLFDAALAASARAGALPSQAAILHLGRAMALFELGHERGAVAAYGTAVAANRQVLTKGYWRDEMQYSADAVRRLARVRQIWQDS